jgi:hypothetical protein
VKKIQLGVLALASYAFSAIAFAGEVGTVPPTQVPEPGTLALLAIGVAGVAAVRLIKRK